MNDIELHEKSVRAFMARKPFSKRSLSSQEMTLFCAALTHDSYTSEALNQNPPLNVESYERLEFLGDAVVELVACEYIYLSSDLREGKMTDFKQEIVANRKISDKIQQKKIDIDSVLLVGHGHRDKKTKTNLIEENMRADAFEALVGAFYVLYGLDEAKRLVKDMLFD